MSQFISILHFYPLFLLRSLVSCINSSTVSIFSAFLCVCVLVKLA